MLRKYITDKGFYIADQKNTVIVAPAHLPLVTGTGYDARQHFLLDIEGVRTNEDYLIKSTLGQRSHKRASHTYKQHEPGSVIVPVPEPDLHWALSLKEITEKLASRVTAVQDYSEEQWEEAKAALRSAEAPYKAGIAKNKRDYDRAVEVAEQARRMADAELRKTWPTIDQFL